MGFYIDPKILKALQKAGEQLAKSMREANERRGWKTPPSSFATGGYISFENDPYKGGIHWDRATGQDHTESFQVWVDDYPLGDQIFVNLAEFNPTPFYYEDEDSGKYNLVEDLTTSQKMRVFRFIRALETAEEL